MLPLSGITVIALEHALAAPYASRQLADLGARVIKIERPQTGDFARHYDTRARGQSSYFAWANRGKESLTLNVKSEPGKEILGCLLENADVFIQNLAPGAIERLGFSDERLQAAYPRLIICHISGYGRDGPYREKKAYDLLVQAEAGLLSITGTPEEPAKVGISVADIATGMYAYSGILAALLARGQSQKGTVIDISMLEALGEWMGSPMYHTLSGEAPPRSGAMHATIAPYGPFTTGDGHMVIIGIQNEREWRNFCLIVLNRADLAEEPHFTGNARRVERRAELSALINAAFSTLTKDEILGRLEQARIANAEMRTMQDFLEHPQLAARRRWRTIDSPTGPLPALLPPATTAGKEPAMKPIPALGMHTEIILAEIGYKPQQINELRQAGTI
jgi:itaconate CoA-transferase